MNDILEDMFDESGALDSINTETTKNLSGLVRQSASMFIDVVSRGAVRPSRTACRSTAKGMH